MYIDHRQQDVPTVCRPTQACKASTALIFGSKGLSAKLLRCAKEWVTD